MLVGWGFLQCVSGSLVHVMLYPTVVELNTSLPQATDGNSTLQAYGRVKFNGHPFQCSKMELPHEENVNRTAVAGLEKVLALFGACWDVQVDMAESKFLRVCIGESVYQYGLNSDGSRSPFKNLASSNPVESISVLPGGLEEVFRGSVETIQVTYICDHAKFQISFSPSPPGQYTKSLTVRSFLFCPSLTDAEIHQIVEEIPHLKIFTDHNFWEYQYKYPDLVRQVHTDIADADLNELYNLGSLGEGELKFENITITSVDPADPFIIHRVKYLLTGGTMCEKFGLERQAAIIFQCPVDWEVLATDAGLADEGWVRFSVAGVGERQFSVRIASVKETGPCEYEYVIEASSLCIDPRFIPKFIAVENQLISCHLHSN